MIEKHPSKIDIAVLLIFFARPEIFQKVFEQVQIARPSKLYLYQDGARENRADDIINIEKCRKIAEHIDWECEVHYKYQDENFGCDPSEFLSQKWVFEKEEQAIVLEDDDVPSQSFFTFCKEMLDYYKDDERIGIICGMNNLGVSLDTPYSYLFARSGSIWGWATWKRNIDRWEEHYDYLNDKYSLSLLEKLMKPDDFKFFINKSQSNKLSGIAHYETILGSHVLLNSKLNIIPTKNLISNIGIGANGTHATDSIAKLPKGIRQVLFMKTYDLEFPLKHPKYVLEDVGYSEKLNRIMGNGYPLVKLYRTVETILLRLRQGDFSNLRNSLIKRLKNAK